MNKPLRGIWRGVTHGYVTPETIGREVDRIRCMPIGAARQARERRMLRDVLDAIESGNNEDTRLCAFVALKSAPKDFAKRRPRGGKTISKPRRGSKPKPTMTQTLVLSNSECVDVTNMTAVEHNRALCTVANQASVDCLTRAFDGHRHRTRDLYAVFDGKLYTLHHMRQRPDKWAQWELAIAPATSAIVLPNGDGCVPAELTVYLADAGCAVIVDGRGEQVLKWYVNNRVPVLYQGCQYTVAVVDDTTQGWLARLIPYRAVETPAVAEPRDVMVFPDGTTLTVVRCKTARRGKPTRCSVMLTAPSEASTNAMGVKLEGAVHDKTHVKLNGMEFIVDSCAPWGNLSHAWMATLLEYVPAVKR